MKKKPTSCNFSTKQVLQVIRKIVSNVFGLNKCDIQLNLKKNLNRFLIFKLENLSCNYYSQQFPSYPTTTTAPVSHENAEVSLVPKRCEEYYISRANKDTSSTL